jgi:hypothetical protein
MKIFEKIFSKRKKAGEEKSKFDQKQELQKEHKDIFDGFWLAKLTLEDMKKMVELKKEIQQLNPEEMKAINAYLKETIKGHGDLARHADKILIAMGVLVTGASAYGGMEASSLVEYLIPATGVLTGVMSTLGGVIERITKKKRGEKGRSINRGTYLYARTKYGKDIADLYLYRENRQDFEQKLMRKLANEPENSGLSESQLRQEAQKIVEELWELRDY